MRCSILLKFGKQMHYGSMEVAELLNLYADAFICLVIKAQNDWRDNERPQIAMHRNCHLSSHNYDTWLFWRVSRSLHFCNIFHHSHTGTWCWLMLTELRPTFKQCSHWPAWTLSVNHIVIQSMSAGAAVTPCSSCPEKRCGCPHRCQHQCVIFAPHMKHSSPPSAPRKWRRRQQRPLYGGPAMQQQRSSRRRNECSCGVRQRRAADRKLLTLLLLLLLLLLPP